MNKGYSPKYNEEKAIAAVSRFLKLSGGQCDKYWLNKLMYYIERQSLILSGQPMFFDALFSVKFGPLVSAINDGIDSASYPIDSVWHSHISLYNNKVKLLKEADYSELSPFEEELIEQVYKKFADWDFDRLYNFFHKLPENKNTNSRQCIEYEEILRNQGCSQEEIEETLEELSYLGYLESALNCAA